LYIVAALLFTYLVVTSLLAVHERLDAATKNAVSFRRRLAFQVNIAIISFGLLSYSMTSFLVVSYQDWLKENHDSFGPVTLWQWTTTSTLFLDFARAICASSAAYFWTQQALLATLLSSLYMRIQSEPFSACD